MNGLMTHEQLIAAPLIEIKFGTCAQTNEQILSVYVKHIRDAVLAARGDYGALSNLYQLFTEARYVVKDLKNEAYLKRREATL